MTSYLRKYVTALASAKDYVAQWSADHVYAHEALIIPFPTLAIFEAKKDVWSVHVKAWLYLPFEGKSIRDYLPSLPSFLSKKTNETTPEEPANEDTQKVDVEKKQTAAAAIADNEKQQQQEEEASEEENDDDDDDLYEDALQDEFGEEIENPGRLGLFFVGNSVKVVTKTIFNGVEHLLQPSDESGFIDQQIELSDSEIASLCSMPRSESDDRKFEYELQVNAEKDDDKPENCKAFKCTVYVLASHGTSVISDIDDTIKVSKVLSTRALLKHTFYSYFKPVPGMSELYQKWSEQKCQFHYVSASPWQLFPALRSFLEKYKYPMGTMNLRKFTWSLKFLKPPDTYKNEIITQIINAYPSRKYICVGDSGELDPEIYSKLYVTFPQNIAHIFIRDVCPQPECLPICAERYKKAFKDVPKERWTVFRETTNLETNVQKLTAM